MFIHMVSKPHYLFKKSFCPSYSIYNKFNENFLGNIAGTHSHSWSLEKLLKITLSTSEIQTFLPDGEENP